MKKERNLTVVHSNDLVEAAYSISTDEMRLIMFAASKVDSRSENVGELKIYPKDFAQTYDLTPRNVHRNLVNSIKSLGNKSITICQNERNVILPWLAKGTYERDSSSENYVSIEFSKYIEPYLFELKERFTTINFEYASKLNTPFSYRLYQWLLKAKNLNSAKEHGAVSVILDNNWMKTQAGLDGLYERWDVFRNRVIEPAIEQINSKTDISVIWEPVRKGRSIQSVKFTYVIETGAFAKPVRPRLKRRPKVIRGSDAEGSWMRANLKLLLDYEAELKRYDSVAKLDIKDVERIAEYSSICDRVTHKRAQRELSERRAKAGNRHVIELNL